MPPIGIACATCANFVLANDKTGHCHANPPHPFLVPAPPNPLSPRQQPQLMIQACWPPVGAGDWCGSHRLSDGMAQPIDRRLAAGAEGAA